MRRFLYGLIIFVSFSLTFFVRNTSEYYSFADFNTQFAIDSNKLELTTYKGNIINAEVNDNGIVVLDGYRYNRKERIQFLAIIVDQFEFKRSVQSLEAEWSLHNILYFMDVAIEETKDVTLDYDGDPRWYVRAGTILCQIMGF